MRETAQASIDFTGVPHLLARPSKGEANGVVVWSEIQPIVDSLSTKLDLAHLKIEQQKNNAAIIKRFPLTGGVAEVKASAEDSENYTYTTFRIPTGFTDNEGNPTLDFEDFAMSAVLQPFSNEGFRYEFHKEAPDVAVIQFQNIAGAFPDDRVRISLIRIPETATVAGDLNPTDPALITRVNNFLGWVDWDTRLGPGTVNRIYRGVSGTADSPIYHFANGNTLSQSQVDGFYETRNLVSIDSVAGAGSVATTKVITLSLPIGRSAAGYGENTLVTVTISGFEVGARPSILWKNLSSGVQGNEVNSPASPLPSNPFTYTIPTQQIAGYVTANGGDIAVLDVDGISSNAITMAA